MSSVLVPHMPVIAGLRVGVTLFVSLKQSRVGPGLAEKNLTSSCQTASGFALLALSLPLWPGARHACPRRRSDRRTTSSPAHKQSLPAPFVTIAHVTPLHYPLVQPVQQPATSQGAHTSVYLSRFLIQSAPRIQCTHRDITLCNTLIQMPSQPPANLSYGSLNLITARAVCFACRPTAQLLKTSSNAAQRAPQRRAQSAVSVSSCAKAARRNPAATAGTTISGHAVAALRTGAARFSATWLQVCAGRSTLSSTKRLSCADKGNSAPVTATASEARK